MFVNRVNGKYQMRVKYLSSILVDFTIVFTFSYLLKILLQYFVIIDHRLLWIIFVIIFFELIFCYIFITIVNFFVLNIIIYLDFFFF